MDKHHIYKTYADMTAFAFNRTAQPQWTNMGPAEENEAGNNTMISLFHLESMSFLIKIQMHWKPLIWVLKDWS